MIGFLSFLDSILPPIEMQSGSVSGGTATGGRRSRRGSRAPVSADRTRPTRSNFATGLVTAGEMAGLLGVLEAWVGASVPDTPTWSAAQAGPVVDGRRRAYPKVHLVIRQLRTPPQKRYEGLCRKLDEQFGLEPNQDTKLLYRRLLSQDSPEQSKA